MQGLYEEQKNYNDVVIDNISIIYEVVSAGEGSMKQKWPVSACMELCESFIQMC